MNFQYVLECATDRQRHATRLLQQLALAELLFTNIVIILSVGIITKGLRELSYLVTQKKKIVHTQVHKILPSYAIDRKRKNQMLTQ